jgi:hypothetical protein
MVAKIKIGKNIRGALHYNENKVVEGEADLILASGFAGDIEKMNFNQKLQRFENLLMLKPNVKTNTLHISLNFDSTEKLDNETLQKIAISYMEKIGFGDQPFLAYRHHDAAHHHIHIVTTNITAKGERIDLHNIGRIQSEQARKEIEIEFSLVKAQSKQFKEDAAIKPVDLDKALYGKTPTKRAISNTVNAVIGSYKFTSVAELNAILKQFNVTADRGTEETMMFQKKGLIYSLLDKHGNKVGVPIKSSSLYSKPTLANLEKQFAQHKENRIALKPDLKMRIDKVLNTGSHTEQSFTDALKKQGVAIVFRRSDGGQIYGVTFVDHTNRVVFNGSDLGKNYTAKAIIDQFKVRSSPKEATKPLNPNREDLQPAKDHSSIQFHQPDKIALIDPLKDLLKPADIGSSVPKRKRRKKKKITL